MIYDSTLWTGAGTQPIWPRLVAYIGSKAAKVLCWALTDEMVRSGRVKDPRQAKYLVQREIREMSETVAYQHDEIEILTARLSRRYDPGQALNEAANRAIADKQKQRQQPELSGAQAAALEYQKAYLAKIVRNA